MQHVSSIVLVGLMGAGKSSVGRRLAEFLTRPFIDMDAYFISQKGMGIPEWFLRYGEVSFRDEEEAILLDLLRKKSGVVLSSPVSFSLLRASSRLTMSSLAHVLYLHAPVETLVDRLKRTDLKQRPVLGVSEGLVNRIESLYKVRDPLYREVADTVVETQGFNPKQLADRLAKSLNVGMGSKAVS
jgi:shikimate kinase